LERWQDLYQRQFGITYRRGGITQQLTQVQALIINCDGDLSLALRCVEALLTHDDLRWVTTVRLEWLANPSNMAFLLPVVRPRAKPTKTAEWQGGRIQTTTISKGSKV